MDLKPYYPPSTYKTFGAGIDHPLSNDPVFSVEMSAIAFVKEQLKIKDDSTIKVQKTVSSDVAHHAYLDQVHNDIPFSNVRINVSFNIRNKVVAFGSSFVKIAPANIAPSDPGVSRDDAISAAEVKCGGTFSGDPPRLEYLATKDGSAVLTYIFQLEKQPEAALIEASVDAHSGQVVRAIKHKG